MSYEKDLILLKKAVEQMAAKYKIPVNFFECRYRKRKKQIVGIKVVIDAQYLDYTEAWTAMNKWKDRIVEFFDLAFTIETFHVDENKDLRIGLGQNEKAPEFHSGADSGGAFR